MPRRVNLIPMAGAGQRFVDAGYLVPKPLIDIGGLPMIVQAARSLPEPDLWIFVCRSEHIAAAKIDETLARWFPGCEVVTVDQLTEGQACTCLLARHLLRDDDILTIGACDNAMTWPKGAFEAGFLRGEADFAVWTFRDNPAVLQDPRMYGWVKVDADGRVTGVSVKVPISEDPMRDHAVIGAFSFRRAGDFLAATDQMIAENSRIKNEFYVDQAINFALQQGKAGRVMEVERYICWGTPRDLDIYNYWRGYFLPATAGAALMPSPEGALGDCHMLRYLLVGGIAVALDIGAYALSTSAGWLEPGLAKRVSFAIGAAWAFFANKYFTFRQPTLRAGEPVLFALVYAIGWALNSVTHDLILGHWSAPWGAVGAATALSICVNYVGQRWIVFREPKPRT